MLRLLKQESDRTRSILLLGPLLTVSAIVALSASCSNQHSQTATVAIQQTSYASPAAAGAALFEAAKTGDQNELMAVFGPEGRDILFSGDAVKDRDAMQRFVKAYTQMNRWSPRSSGDEILCIGADNFPFPVPLARNASGQWVFNTAGGKDEILARRIGDGELTAIGVLTEVVEAQHEYFDRARQFAQKFVSDPGQHNGLYWPAEEGQRASPLGRLAEEARALGYSESDKPQPFNGYYYKILTQQGDAAKGGAKDYERDGKLTQGFALVAWPAKYRDSGITTFLVAKDGRIYQKDLGENTMQQAGAMTTYNPDAGWTVVLTPDSPGARRSSPTTKS